MLRSWRSRRISYHQIRQREPLHAEELREQGREKLQENIDAGKYNINSRLPTSESGEEATEVAHKLVLDQLRKQIEQRGLTRNSVPNW